MLLERVTLPPVPGRDDSPEEKIDEECDLAVIAFLQGRRRIGSETSPQKMLECRLGAYTAAVAAALRRVAQPQLGEAATA